MVPVSPAQVSKCADKALIMVVKVVNVCVCADEWKRYSKTLWVSLKAEKRYGT